MNITIDQNAILLNRAIKDVLEKLSLCQNMDKDQYEIEKNKILEDESFFFEIDKQYLKNCVDKELGKNNSSNNNNNNNN